MTKSLVKWWGRAGERFYFKSWEKDPRIKVTQLPFVDISVENNFPIGVFIFHRTHSLSVPFILKGPVIPSLGVQPTRPSPVYLCLFPNLVESRRQDGQVWFPLEMETAVYLARCKVVVLFSKITWDTVESRKVLFSELVSTSSQINFSGIKALVLFRACLSGGRRSDFLRFCKGG